MYQGERCKYRHAFVSEAERERIEEHRREKAEIRQKEHDPSDPFEDKLPRSARAKMYSSSTTHHYLPQRSRARVPVCVCVMRVCRVPQFPGVVGEDVRDGAVA
jgi:hypothetical protein